MEVIHAVKTTALELFKARVNTTRTLNGDSADSSYLLYFYESFLPDPDQPLPCNKYEEDDTVWTETRGAYCRTPGNSLREIQALMRNALPDDFLEFYQGIREGLLITLSHPSHFWSEEKMIEEMQAMRDDFGGSLRFLRFGDYDHLEATQFALWQSPLSSAMWHVITTSHERRDDFYDSATLNDVYVWAEDFTSWMKQLVETDGVRDPLCMINNLESIFRPA